MAENFEYKKLMTSLLYVDTYQRPLSSVKVKKAVAEYNPRLVNPIKVSYREDEQRYYIFDGQHTKAILERVNDGKPLMADCKVYYGLTREDEARMFEAQNGVSSSPTRSQRIKALYEAADPDVTKFVSIVTGFNVRLNFASGHSPVNCLACVPVAYDIFIDKGETRLYEILTILLAAWSSEKDALNGKLISGLNLFLDRYTGVEDFNTIELARKLGETTPQAIIRKGNESLAKGKAARYAEYILRAYNARRKRPLPGSFI